LSQLRSFLKTQNLNRKIDLLSPDSALVLLAQKGDREAFSVLLARYRDRIYATLFGLTGDRDISEDLLQDVSLKAHLSINRFRGESQFYTWLYRVAVNRWKDWRISMGRRREDILDEVVDRTPGIHRADARVENAELCDLLGQALQELPDMWRQVIVLREIEGLTYEEIAQVLSCSIGTVKSRLFRARGMLRDILIRDHQDLGRGYNL
jgi:RNA polymerase sigma-70 factor (ECF subfamily)